MPCHRPMTAVTVLLLAMAAPAAAVVVGGGGPKARDCVSVFDATGVNSPAPPRTPRNIDCVDGDPACDMDGTRNASCTFSLRLCVNSSNVAGCTPERADDITIQHAQDNGDPRFDTDFQALQARADLLGFPDQESLDRCTQQSAITVVLKGNGSGVRMLNKKLLRLTALGAAGGRPTTDRDRMKLTCRPEGNGVYSPHELYGGTFDRIAHEVFAQSCALSGCHDSETHQADEILLPNAAYSQIVGVTPTNPSAATAGLQRIFPGDPMQSFLYRKITADLEAGWGLPMPRTGPALSPQLIEIIRLWIIGDSTLGPAPQDGWVAGTDG